MINFDFESKDVEKILKEHSIFYESQQTRDINFRIKQLNILKDIIKKYEERIYKALYKDLGKSEFESYTTEIGFVLSSISYAIKNLKKWARPRKIRTPFYLFPSRSFIINEPYGTVLIIGPFNYPFQLLFEPLIGAIAAGNCVVLKPSENAPHVSAVIAEMISKSFNKGYIRCIEGGVKINIILSSAKFDYIFFTGSVEVGKEIMKAAAKNLTPVTLELGGKSPVIVDESADIKIAAERIIWGKSINVGQTCVAPDYVVVHESVKVKLIEEMISKIVEFYGSNISENKDFGRIVNDNHFKRLNSILRDENDRIIYGGKIKEEDKFIEPTILDLQTWSTSSMKEEIFGPILPIITYKNIDFAINEIKKLSKPLAIYIFTKNKQFEKNVLNEIPSGGVCINDTIIHLINPRLPFGGVGNSGIGSYHGKYSFITFSHQRSIVKKNNKINIKIMFPPYTKMKLKIIKRILK